MLQFTRERVTMLVEKDVLELAAGSNLAAEYMKIASGMWKHQYYGPIYQSHFKGDTSSEEASNKGSPAKLRTNPFEVQIKTYLAGNIDTCCPGLQFV